MISSNIYIFLCMALIGVSLIGAQEGPREPQREPHREPQRGPQQGPQQEPQHDDRRFRFPFSSVTITAHRNGDAASQQDPADRTLFSLIPRLVSCNQTQQGSVSCSSCDQVLVCFSNNIGIRHSCGSLYCNGGICSDWPSPACNSTSV